MLIVSSLHRTRILYFVKHMLWFRHDVSEETLNMQVPTWTAMFSELLHETLVLLLKRAMRLLSPQGVPTQRSTNNAFSLIGHASLSQHKLSKATPTKGHFATWLAHSLPEPIYLKASEQHRGIGIMRRTSLRIDGCSCLKILEVCEFGGNENRRGAFVCAIPNEALVNLRSANWNITPIEPKAQGASRKDIWIETIIVQECNLRLEEI